MKYIPADKLIAEIKRQKHELELSIQSQGDYGQSCHIVAYENILSLIDSLQQEQPAKRGYKDCNGCENNRLLKDQIGWQFRGCFGGDYKGKPIAEIELCPLKVINQHEQPEVDLEKALDEYYKNADFGPSEAIEYEIHKDIARHFYNLGLNGKK